MAIFNKTNQSANYASNLTTIADGCKFEGKVDLLCALHVDGEYIGELSSSNVITVGKTGIVKGELKADKLVVAGKFNGNAECEVIELISGGHSEGTLTCCSLSIDGEASFQGQSIRKSPGDKDAVVDFRKSPKLAEQHEQA